MAKIQWGAAAAAAGAAGGGAETWLGYGGPAVVFGWTRSRGCLPLACTRFWEYFSYIFIQF